MQLYKDHISPTLLLGISSSPHSPSPSLPSLSPNPEAKQHAEHNLDSRGPKDAVADEELAEVGCSSERDDSIVGDGA